MVSKLLNNEEILQVVQEWITDDSVDGARLCQVFTRAMADIRYFFCVKKLPNWID